MKTNLILSAGILIASLMSLPAFAQPAPVNSDAPVATTQKNPGIGQGNRRARQPRDCAQASNPANCAAQREARMQARDACKGKNGPERQQCMIDQHQKHDCSKAANPQQCEARKEASKACQGQTGTGFRQCIQEKTPAPDCSKSADPKRCELHQKARSACKEKLGPEHKTCLREQFKTK